MRFTFILITITLAFSGCFLDTEETTEVIIKPVPSVTIASANVVVKVQDESGQPISGLTARFNKITKVVEKTSVFHFNGKNIRKENELLSLTTAAGKSYEFNLYNIENQTNYHQITLFSKVGKTIFSNRETHSMTLPSNSFELQFVPQVYHTGTLDYAGEVRAEYIDYDMSNPIHLQALPGGNIVVDKGIKKLIKIKKAFYLNLTTPDEKSLTWKLPHIGMFNQAFPASSYLLHYEAATHQWKIISGPDLTKEIPVSASGTYIVAELEDVHMLSGTWSVDNNPLPGHVLEITSEDFSTMIHTTNTGYWEAIVPANRKVLVKALFGCPSNVQAEVQTIGDMSSAGVRNFLAQGITFIEAQGQLLDCNHEPLPEGLLLFERNDVIEVVYIDQYQFNVRLPVCTGTDWTFSVKTRNVTSTEIKSSLPQFNLGNIYVCEDLTEQYIVVKTTEGFSNIFQSIQFEDDGQVMVMEMNNEPVKFQVKIKHTGAPGIIPNSNANIVWRDPNFINTGIEIECPSSSSCGFQAIELTQYSEDKWVRGSLSGRFWTKTFNPLRAKYQNVHIDFQLNKH